MQPVYNSIHLIGPIGTLCDGYAYHNRAIINMLMKGGIDLKLSSLEPGHKGIPMSEDQGLIKLLMDSKAKPEADIIFNCCLPPSYSFHPNKVNIGFFSWETQMVPSSWITNINKLTALFVPSEEIKKVMITNGVKVPVYVLPLPIDVKSIESIQPSYVMEHEQRQCTFIYSGAYTPRKNFEDLILAFSEVFDNNNDVALVIKTWAPSNDAGTRTNIQNAISHLSNKIGCNSKPKIFVLTDQLSDQEHVALLKGADIFVSVSRGEGLDISLVTSMALGKIVISDFYLGKKDYLMENNCILFESKYRPIIDSGSPFHSGKMKWAAPDYISLCKALYKGYEEFQSGRKHLQFNAKNTIISKYNDKKVLDTFLENVKEIVTSYEQKNNISIRSKVPTIAGILS